MSFEPIISSIVEDPAEVIARLGAVLVEQRRAVATLLGSGIKPVEGGFQLDRNSDRDPDGVAQCC